MTNEQVRDGFTEVYNGFWCRYKNRIPGRGSPEWEHMHAAYAEIIEKYPCMGGIIIGLYEELIRRDLERA